MFKQRSPRERGPVKRSTKNQRPASAVIVSLNPSPKGEYRVGPGHPPREYQFRKGQTGNILGGKLRKRSIAPDLKALLQRILNEKMPRRQGEKILTKAEAGMRHLVDQFARGDRNARRDLIHIAEKLGIDLTAGDALKQSVAVALTQNDQELVDDFVQHYLAERKHSRERVRLVAHPSATRCEEPN